MPHVGRILSAGRRERYVADPKSAGSGARYMKLHIMRDVSSAVDDMNLIMRMSPDGDMVAHVRRQIERLEWRAGGAAGGEDGGAAGGEDGGAGVGGIDGTESTGSAATENDLEARLWG